MMQTRCPRCQTLFRVTPEQLKARQGKVRCGHCQSVFDALSALEEEKASVVPGALVVSAQPETPPLPPEPEPAPPPDPLVESAPPEPVPEEDSAQPEPESSTEDVPESFALEPLLPDEDEPPRRWPWVMGILAALLAIVLQAAILWRVELAVLSPELKPALLTLCDLAGCDLPLPQKIDLIDIESSDLHPDPGAENRLQLVANLRNQAPFPQTWPHLELTLTDVSDRPLVRKVFSPAEYLPANAASGFPAKGGQPVTLRLEAVGIAAVGYRVGIFYP